MRHPRGNQDSGYGTDARAWSVYVPEEIDDEDHLEEVKREEECDVEPCDGGDELPF